MILAAAGALACGCSSPGNPPPSAEVTASPSQDAPIAATDAASATITPTRTAASADATAVSPPQNNNPQLNATPSGPCPDAMILVAGGTLTRHKPGARKKVEVKAFCMDRAEVTVSAYKLCVKEQKCSPRCLEIGKCTTTGVPADADWPSLKESVRASTFCNGTRTDRDDHPVNCVSFDEAKGYCEARGKRLPTGDEWEWTAVGNKPAPIFPWGPQAPGGEELCWGRPYKRPSTCLPGTYPKDTTRDGVVDMAGNLSEWVVTGSADKPWRGLRGSSWYAIDDGYIEAALWGFDSTSSRSEVFGFRCAKEAAASPAPKKSE